MKSARNGSPSQHFPGSHSFRWMLQGVLSVVVVLFGLGPAHWCDAQAFSASEPATGTPSAASTYQIGPQDVLQISVWKDESLSREVIVRPDGFITFPLIGEVLAEDRTVGDLAKEMDERLKQFVGDPRITVAISHLNSLKIFVIGKVNAPGGFQLGRYTDVMQALSLAGGLTPLALEGSIKILRRVKGNQEVFPFNYGEVLKGKNLDQNIILQRGDIVMVP